MMTNRRFIKGHISLHYIGKDAPEKISRPNRKVLTHVSLSRISMAPVVLLSGDYLNEPFDHALYFDGEFSSVNDYTGTGIHEGPIKEFIYHLIIENPVISRVSEGQNRYACEISGTGYATIKLQNTEEAKPVEEKTLAEDKKLIRRLPLFLQKTTEKAEYNGPTNNVGCLNPFIRSCLGLLTILLLLMLFAWLLQNKGCINQQQSVTEDRDSSATSDDTIQINSNQINIAVYDWDEQDNDIISIFVNDKPIAENVLLTFVPQSFLVNNLQPGITNTIRILAISQGKGKTTPTIEIYAGKDLKIMQVELSKGESQIIPVIIRN